MLVEPFIGIALAIGSATSLLDLDGVIIDGSVDRSVLERRMVQVDVALDFYSGEGISGHSYWPAPSGRTPAPSVVRYCRYTPTLRRIATCS